MKIVRSKDPLHEDVSELHYIYSEKGNHNLQIFLYLDIQYSVVGSGYVIVFVDTYGLRNMSRYHIGLYIAECTAYINRVCLSYRARSTVNNASHSKTYSIHPQGSKRVKQNKYSLIKDFIVHTIQDFFSCP